MCVRFVLITGFTFKSAKFFDVILDSELGRFESNYYCGYSKFRSSKLIVEMPRLFSATETRHPSCKQAAYRLHFEVQRSEKPAI
jgi:hypothetical protein